MDKFKEKLFKLRDSAASRNAQAEEVEKAIKNLELELHLTNPTTLQNRLFMLQGHLQKEEANLSQLQLQQQELAREIEVMSEEEQVLLKQQDALDLEAEDLTKRLKLLIKELDEFEQSALNI